MNQTGKSILLAGNPNAGKTTLFNVLTGARGKVGNYPGVTVDRRTATLDLGEGLRVDLIDLPGSYSFTARSPEERVAIDAVLEGGNGDAPDSAAIVAVIDATTLRRGLYLATQMLDVGAPLVVALTMMDEAKRAGIVIDVKRLSEELGCAVIPMVATRGEGKQQLLDAIRAAVTAPSPPPPRFLPATDLAADVAAIEAAIAGTTLEPGGPRRSTKLTTRAYWALLSLGDDDLQGIPQAVRDAVLARRQLAKTNGRDLDEALVTSRYALVDTLLDGVVRTQVVKSRSRSERIDDVLMHPVWGLLLFALVMFVLFQALFAWSEPFVGLIEDGVAALKAAAKAGLPEGAFSDLVSDGVIAGVGNVVVFVPQIALLFVFLTILEDSGYLARVAFVIDRVMAKVGLNGRAFVPMLSGFACAIPAIMATRTIESRRDRLLTMLVIPLSSCSARLPVYVLVAGVVFDRNTRLLGFLSTGALALFAMYVVSVIASLGAAFVIGRTVLKGPRPTLVLELPPYRFPRASNVTRATTQRVRRFLVDAGTVILALTIVLWALLNYPKDAASEQRFSAQLTEAASIEDDTARSEAVATIESELAGERLRNSAGGRMGRVMEPALEPLGFDWKIGVGLVGAFAAREVFVSTLGLVYDVTDATEEDQGLQAALRQARHRDGTPVFTPLSGIALMVFFVLACQCMSTLAIVRRESGSWKWAGFMFAYMTTLAYVVTLIVYQSGRALGLGLG